MCYLFLFFFRLPPTLPRDNLPIRLNIHSYHILYYYYSYLRSYFLLSFIGMMLRLSYPSPSLTSLKDFSTSSIPSSSFFVS